MKRPYGLLALAGAAAIAAALVMTGPGSAQTIPVSELAAQTHVHGLGIDPQDPSKLLIATHHGLFRADEAGNAERISVVQDFMGFSLHPNDPGTLYASGHPRSGGNLGFIASTDGGQTWQQISPGLGGPVDFHQMTVSPADPNVIYGAYGVLQVSRDGGRNWASVGPPPSGLIALAASALDPNVLYAATEAGLVRSTDGGQTWEALVAGAPVSMVTVTPEGTLYAFVLGRGLVRAAEESLELAAVGNDFPGGYLLHLAVHPSDPTRLFAADQSGQVIASSDGGASWRPFGG